MGKSAKKEAPVAGINEKTTAFGIGDRVKHKETGHEHVIVDDNDDGGFRTFNRDTSAMNDMSPSDMDLFDAIFGDDTEEDDETVE